MELNLKGKTALVTGTSQGIGRCIAKMLAAEGVKLCIAARRNHAVASSARASWRARPASRSMAWSPASVAAKRVATSTNRPSASHSRACALTSSR